ncbi:hypothetical protein HNQ77_002003 [Silvibacterium bohemicum]|uniref:Uncharacterized protein n=1 Tax=Silvibacterium bohemicum TaxID=1577686 RepID=A0A841JYK2_9BACT|nr:hypothetical protein [Silvibacterium bohemicum]MBB6144051.1 hypothetical protein [Silvibacterium bohemicum]
MSNENYDAPPFLMQEDCPKQRSLRCGVKRGSYLPRDLRLQLLNSVAFDDPKKNWNSRFIAKIRDTLVICLYRSPEKRMAFLKRGEGGSPLCDRGLSLDLGGDGEMQWFNLGEQKKKALECTEWAEIRGLHFDGTSYLVVTPSEEELHPTPAWR